MRDRIDNSLHPKHGAMMFMRSKLFLMALVLFVLAMSNRVTCAQQMLWANYMQQANELMEAKKGNEAVTLFQAALRALDNDEMFVQMYADGFADGRLAVTQFNLARAYKLQDDSVSEADSMSRAESAIKLVEQRRVAHECETLLQRAAAERRRARDVADTSDHPALSRLNREERAAHLRLASLLESQSRNLAELVSSIDVHAASLLCDGGEKYAERLLLIAIELRSKYLGIATMQHVEAEFALADLLFRTERPAEAVSRLTLLADSLDKQEGLNDPLIATVLMKIAELHIADGAPETAEPLLARSVSLTSAYSESPLFRKALTAYRDVLQLLDRDVEAAAIDRQLRK